MTAGACELPAAPPLLAVHATLPDRWPFLLASSARAGHLGRWSILLRAEIERSPLRLDAVETSSEGFLDRLSKALEHDAGPVETLGDRLPFCGGWFVYLGYELAGEIEPRLNQPPAADALPVALAQRCRAALLHDHLEGRSWLVAEDAAGLRAAREEVAATPASMTDPSGELGRLELTTDPGDRFRQGVREIREYIRAGDVFQVNLSRGWEARGEGAIDAAGLYARLARSNPAPFAALARMPGGTLVSSSPERLVRIDGRRVQTRPIAGTRPRGRSDHDDQRLSSELVSHPKERAEHIMLIDLERNDLGRVCEVGSVEVDELMVVESYAHVHHIVSNVRGRLRPEAGPADVIRAIFPGGTITGCPKVRCMEIIAELERVGRSFYTGALGYIDRSGRMDLNILIRSMLVDGDRIAFRTGAGIVADSDPDAELAETEDKALGLLRAIDHG